MGEDRRSGRSVHGREPSRNVEQLGKTVYSNKHVGGFEIGRIPEDHPGFEDISAR